MGQFPLGYSVVTLGRHPNCDVVIPQNFLKVSREHAQVRYENGRYVLYDASTHGTLLNRRRISRQELQDGDTFSMAGEVSFLFSNGTLYDVGRGAVLAAGQRRPLTSYLNRPRASRPAYRSGSRSDGKDRVMAAVLAFFLGGIGAHRFYLGQVAAGILYLVFCWTMIPALIALIEGITYLSMSDESFDRQYNFY